MSIDPVSLGMAFFDFVFQNHTKILKANAGSRRADMLTLLNAQIPKYASDFNEFFSDDDVFEMFENLHKGSDFEELLEAFEEFCAKKGIKINTEEILREIKKKEENFSAETDIDAIFLEYHQRNEKKMDKLQATADEIKEIVSQGDVTVQSMSDEKIIDYIKELTSKLELSKLGKFEMAFSVNGEKKNVTELVDWAKSVRISILRGVAGGGKTSVMKNTIKKLCEGEIVPVLINLREWDKNYAEKLESRSGDVAAQMNVLLRMSVGTISEDELASIGKERWIIVDGLNEISAGTADKVTGMILDTTREYSRQIGGTCIVTDRDVSRRYPSAWSIASLELLNDEEVRKHVDEKFGEGEFDKLEEDQQRLLFVPFFLKMALNRETPSLGSEASVLEDFFKEQLRLKDDELDNLAFAAFNAYKIYGSRRFDLEKFKELSGDKICQKLVDGAIIRDERKGASFDHQLQHDYLVSRYLASHDDTWTLESFEIASLQANSLESLTMVLEQLEKSESIDEFLEAVYDWNWYAAMDCTRKATNMGAKGPSKEMEMMMLAVATQKIFDNVYRTSTSAKAFVEKFDTQAAKELLACLNMQEVCIKVKSGGLSGNKFLEWQEFFTRDRHSNISKDDIDMIKKSSLMGWTAANILKEFNLDANLQERLRTIYELFDSDNPRENTIRWRVVHAVGAFDSKENADLLLQALDKDPYLWAKYGAARSLIEMTARTSDEALRKTILSELENRASLPVKVLEEIGRAANRKNPPEGWTEQILPLLEKYRDAETSKDYVDEWEKIIEEFKEERWKK